MMAAQLKLNEFYRILTRNYLDTMNYGRLVDQGIVGMLGQLDPHSVYLTAEEMREAEQSFGGSFSGIGVEFNVLNDTIVVVNTIHGGPAEKVGVMPNDRIIGIDGRNAVGMKRSEVPDHLRGPKNTKVAITVFRRGSAQPLDFTITRGDIPLNTVDAAYMIDDRTGYIRVNRFANNTMREFVTAFNGFGGVEGLILDLRGNGGGLLPQALAMSEFFLDKGQVIVSTEGNMEPTRVTQATRDGQFNRGRLIILVDEGSASGSEIVAGAVQDWDRGIIIGRPTFGKGLVQRQFDMSDGSGLRITISRYLTPTGRAIQRPYELGHKDDYYTEHYMRWGMDMDNANEMQGSVYRTLKTGRPVYGGGGIHPDIYVAADTTAYSDYWSRLVRSGTMFEFVQSYLDANRLRLQQAYPDFGSYLADGRIGDTLAAELAAFAESRGIERDAAGFETSRALIAAQLKALVAQRLWDTTAYYRVVHATHDEIFQRARAVMEAWYDLKPPPVSHELLTEITG